VIPVPFSILFFLISLIALLLATYTDLKERIVSNKITYSLIFGGIILQSVRAFVMNDPSIIIVVGAVTFLTAVGSLLLHRAGAWAGGDVKLMTGLAALNPVNHGVLASLVGLSTLTIFGFTFNFSPISFPIFPLELFFFSIFSMLPYGAILTVNRLIKKKDLMAEFSGKLKKRFFRIVVFSLLIVGLNSAFVFFGIPAMFIWPALILLILIGIYDKAKIVEKIAAVILFLFAIYLSAIDALNQLLWVFVPLVFIYILLMLFFLSRTKVLRRDVLVENLEEGEIPSKTIVARKGKIAILEEFSIGKLIKHLMNNNLEVFNQASKPEERVVVSSTSAAGLTEEQLKELKELAKKGLIAKKIEVKETAPFVPAILIGYLLLQLVGDVLWQIIGLMYL